MSRTSSAFMGHPVVMAIILGWTLCFWMGWVPGARAQSLTDRLTGSPKQPWQISADTVGYDAETTTYHARGNVIIEKQTTRLVADAVDFNHQAMTALATGHVVMTAGNDILTGDRLDLNLNQETGVVHDGTIFLAANHFYIRGERIEKTGKETYRAEEGAVTTCDGDHPDWVITGRTVKVTIEGYGSATHAVLKAGKVPLLYTPYILFPVKTRRQTGLLVPKPEYSDRKGFAWDQPLFWAINDSTDATLYTHYMQKRGTKIGLEYRYAATEGSYGTIMVDGLEDRQVDDGSPEATKAWGYAGDAYNRPNTDRYWLRAKLDQELPGNAKARLDLDWVSDQDYLDEFRNGQSGFDASQDHFLDTFDRELDTYDENVRTNRLNINKTWARYTLNSDFLWNDDVTKRRWEETDNTLQQLPTVEFNGAKQSVFGSSLYWDLESEYTYFYRQDGDRGHRSDLYPRVYLPLKLKNYLSLEPSAGWRQTVWVMDRWEDETLDRSSYRQIYDLQLDLSTVFSKVMETPLASVDRIRHSIKPRVVYTYIPDQDQSDLPAFTGLDRIAEANAVTYALTNTFTARTLKKAPPAQPDGNDATPAPETGLPDRMHNASRLPPLYNYHRFCRFYLEQTYDIAAAKDDLPQPFSDIYGELEFDLEPYFSIIADATYDTYQSTFSSRNAGVNLADHRDDRLWVEHRYTKDLNESLYSTLTVKLTDRLSVRGEYERNLLEAMDITKGAGFLYAAQCWSVDFFYAKEGEDQRFSFLINLMGLGEFGK